MRKTSDIVKVACGVCVGVFGALAERLEHGGVFLWRISSNVSHKNVSFRKSEILSQVTQHTIWHRATSHHTIKAVC
ncbi:hypothetical protein E2C01_026351 [Portunus trituberculatus]|uniref:Uncharacterized protein n=1 Tax=Portunus trituberculatus TaxID=210409 RepID=A0A5B7EIX7_PORTR|nr:hypothetical protein [Portunus trituberculatus]